MSFKSPIGMGSILKIGATFYKVLSEQDLHYKYAVSTAVAAAGSNTVDLTELKPASNWIYWIESIGVDGGLSFQLRFPKNTIRNQVTAGAQQYYDRVTAGRKNPVFISFFVTEVLAPSLFYINNESVSVTSDFYFEGLMFNVEKLTPGFNEIPPDYYEVPDFATLLER